VNNWFLLGGVEVPMVGPKSNTFDYSMLFQVVKGY
jgi:hypothetical protein